LVLETDIFLKLDVFLRWEFFFVVLVTPIRQSIPYFFRLLKEFRNNIRQVVSS